MLKSSLLTNFYEQASIENKKVFSIEVIPPLAESEIVKTTASLREIAKLNPSYISVTRRAEGTDDFTIQLCRFIQDELGIVAVPHITAVHQTKDSKINLIKNLKAANIQNMLLVRGDTPQSQHEVAGSYDEVSSLMSQLMDHLSTFCIAVAAIPEGYPHLKLEDREKFADNALLKKQSNGAAVGLTQLFLDKGVWSNFMSRIKELGVSIPVIPGMMPVTSQKRLSRMVEITGLSVPKELKTYEYLPQEEFRSKGLDFTEALVLQLLKTAPGIHFFSFNSSKDVSELKDRLSGSVNWL